MKYPGKNDSHIVHKPEETVTLDELFEALTLIQTKRIKSFPVILIDSSYWKDQIDRIKQTLIKEKSISQSDLTLLNIVDTPEEAIRIIKKTVIV